MNKFWLGLGVVIAVLSFGSSVYLIITKINKPVVSPEMPQLSINSTSTPDTANLLTLVDPTGFTIKYPSGLMLNKHDEDKINYAHLEFTSKDHAGGLIIWAKDTKALDTQGWTKSEKRFTNANILDTLLGGKKAKKISVASPQKMLVTGVVDGKIVYIIETTLDENGFWNKVHETVSDNFIFSTPTFAPDGNEASIEESGQAAGDEGEPVDEEETLE